MDEVRRSKSTMSNNKIPVFPNGNTSGFIDKSVTNGKTSEKSMMRAVSSNVTLTPQVSVTALNGPLA